MSRVSYTHDLKLVPDGGGGAEHIITELKAMN